MTSFDAAGEIPDNPLLNYFVRNGGNRIHKWVDYFEIYHRCFERFRGKPIKFLEIGVQNGGSGEMWQAYFGPAAKIIGVDIDPACKRLETPQREIWIGDQSDPAFWNSLCQVHPAFDVVLDDGGHTMQQQIVALEALFPRVKEHGLYVCEDTHTSYFAHHGGGLNHPKSFVETIKRLVDEMHAWYHAPISALGQSYWAHHLYAVSFFDSIVVLEKRTRNPPLTLARGQKGHAVNAPAMSFLDIRHTFGVPD